MSTPPSKKNERGVFAPQNMAFRQLLIEARKELQLSQVQLARLLQRPQSFVSKYERGERRLDVVEFLEVAVALNIDPVQILRKMMRFMSDGKKKNSHHAKD